MAKKTIQEQLDAYMKLLAFQNDDDRKKVYEIYKKIIETRGITELTSYYDPDEHRRIHDLDWFDELALIPMLPRMCEQVAERKSFEKDKIGWKFLGVLFKEWLKRPINITTSSTPNTHSPVLVADNYGAGMKWVLEFDEPRNVYEKLIQASYFQTPNFLMRLTDVFQHEKTANLIKGRRFWVDVILEKGIYKDKRKKHEKHLQTLEVSDKLRNKWSQEEVSRNAGIIAKFAVLRMFGAQNANGLDAALHGFSLHAILAGSIVSVTADEVVVTLDTLAVYYKDSFDFSDDHPGEDQPLGDWGIPYKPAHPMVSLSNGSFRRYREMMGVGGDFYIISDNKIVKAEERGWTNISYAVPRKMCGPARIVN